MAGIEQFIEDFKKVLAENRGIEYAFISGSSVKALRPGGDIDVLAGGRVSFTEKVELAMRLELIVKRKVDVVSSEEASPEIIMNAFSRGLKVIVNNKERLKEDYFKNLYAYEDIDMIEHIVVDEDYGLPESYYGAAQILSEKAIIDEKDMNVLKKMIGFRNVIGREYIKINKEIVYNILMNNLADIKTVVSKIVQGFI